MQQQKPQPLITVWFVLVVFLPVWITALGLFWATGQKVHLTCDRLEWYYTQCQWQQLNSYGFRPTPKVPFRLQTARIEEYQESDGDGGTYTAYKLDLITTTRQPIELHRYKADYSQAYADLGKILDFLGDPRQPTFQIEKENLVSDGFTAAWVLLYAALFGIPLWLFLLNWLQSKFR